PRAWLASRRTGPRARSRRYRPQPPCATGGLQRLVDLRQPAIIDLALRQHRIGRQGLPDPREHAEVGRKGVAQFVVRDALLRGDKALVAGQAAVHAREISEALLEGGRQGVEQL